jgi:neopullulanase
VTFAKRLAHLMANYRREFVAAQLNLLDSHDTARFVTIAGGDIASLRLALLATMTLTGAPCVYYGDEVGLPGRQDPDSRRSFPWDESRWESGMRDYTKAVIALRHANPVLRHGAFKLLAAEGSAVAYGRFLDGATAMVVLNAGDEPVRLQFATDHQRGTDHRRGTDLPAVRLPGWEAPRVSLDDGTMSIQLAGRSGGAAIIGGAL